MMPGEHHDSGYKTLKWPGIQEGGKRVVRNLSFIGLKQVYFKVLSFAKTTDCFQVAKITNQLGTNIHVQILVVSYSGHSGNGLRN